MSKRVYCRYNGEKFILEEHQTAEKTILFTGDILDLELFLIFETEEKFTFYDTQTLVNGDDLLVECRNRLVETSYAPPIVLSNGSRSSAQPRVKCRSVD